MSVSTFQQSSLSSQAQVVDGDVSVLARLGAAFAPHAQSIPDLSMVVDAGQLFDGVSLSEVAAQTAAGFAAPAANPRIDRVVIDQLSGAVSVVSGTEAATPAAPAIPGGKAPVAQVLLPPNATAITNAMITDERDLSSLGRIIAVEAGEGLTGGGTSGVVTIGLETPVAVALGGTGVDEVAAKEVFIGPLSGNDAPPSWRQLQLSDLPADVATTEEVNQAAPAGAVQHFAMSTAPNGWLAANGAAVSRTTYANLFTAIGTTFGAGDGSTTFNLPDLRGEFMRGWDSGRGVNPTRAFGSGEAATEVGLPVFFGVFGGQVAFASIGCQNADSNIQQDFSSSVITNLGEGAAWTALSSPGSGFFTTRPRNVALLACIKY